VSSIKGDVRHDHEEQKKKKKAKLRVLTRETVFLIMQYD
jgi:hypothetical protein